MILMTLPREVILDIVEQLDADSTKHFMATSKVARQIAQAHERSLSKARVAKFGFEPTGAVLSSSHTERYAIPAYTFGLCGELELRELRVNYLLTNTTQYLNISSPPGLPALSVEQQGRLMALMRRALNLCDSIADIAANDPCKPVPGTSYDAVSTSVWSSQYYPKDLYDFDPFANPAARPYQVAYIRSLSTEDLAIIYFLVNMLGLGFSEAKKFGVSDPNVVERIMVFEECVLRHGTWFLWAQTQRGRTATPGMPELAGEMQRAGLRELTAWESGDPDIVAGLKMTLLDSFRGQSNADPEVLLKMFKVVRGLVVGKDKPTQEKKGEEQKDIKE
ncbi:hypothetical protein F5Y15DRAFT_304587 [Xylariaceae sp. FL0016]|nr:hypothetical protein F5Y15DRAFT_304587 [Xylariaceae sp. FL0016]